MTPYYHGFVHADGDHAVTHHQGAMSFEELSAPKGFDWGDANDGAMRLAKAILSDFMDRPPRDLVEAFVEDHVSQWNREFFEIADVAVQDWIERKTREAAGE